MLSSISPRALSDPCAGTSPKMRVVARVFRLPRFGAPRACEPQAEESKGGAADGKLQAVHSLVAGNILESLPLRPRHMPAGLRSGLCCSPRAFLSERVKPPADGGSSESKSAEQRRRSLPGNRFGRALANWSRPGGGDRVVFLSPPRRVAAISGGPLRVRATRNQVRPP